MERWNGAEWLAADGPRGRWDLQVDATGRIAALTRSPLTAPGPKGREATGFTLVAGFVDLQVNGGFGHDFTADPGSLWEVASRLPAHGVTAFLPTIITAPLEIYEAALAVTRAGPPPGWRGAIPLGWHFEGPFLAPERKGAHEAEHLRAPDQAAVAGWSRAAGVRLVTLAPELPGALDLVRSLRARGVVVSAGHSGATEEEARAGFEAGIEMVTHLYNAMSGLHHREPGLVGAALDRRAVHVGVIPDGLHVAPAALRLAARLKPGGLVAVTDAMAALGCADGTYDLAGQSVHVRDGEARLAGGTLAGSVLRMDQAVRNLRTLVGLSPAEAVRAATGTPARLIGEPERGELRPGGRADCVLLGPSGHAVVTMVGGEVLHAGE